MKKQLTALLAMTMAAGMIAGCSTAQTPETTTETTTVTETEATTAVETTVEETEETTATVSEEGYKTGLAVVSSLEKSKDAKADADGNAQVDSVAAAVVLDEDGKIVKCVVDTAQNKMVFTAEGKVVMESEFKTKKELGADYGMKPASSIEKEWDEQIQAFEEYVIGKTPDEVAGIAVNEDMVTEDVDLVSSVTIKIGNYIDAVVEAAENAEVLGTNADDELALGIVTNMNKSKDAQEDKEGQCQAYSTYMAVTTDADGVITANVIDCTQGTITFDNTGKITNDLTEGVKTKRQLGDDYGMKAASGIGKEWFEQAKGFSDYIVGKTLEEVNAIAVDDSEHPTDADLTSSVTISIGDYKKALEKAIK